LSGKIDEWRDSNYPCDDYPAIREILEFAVEDDETGQLRYLRRAQFRALESADTASPVRPGRIQVLAGRNAEEPLTSPMNRSDRVARQAHVRVSFAGES